MNNRNNVIKNISIEFIILFNKYYTHWYYKRFECFSNLNNLKSILFLIILVT